MKPLLLILALAFVLFSNAQTDSTEIKLQHYKDMYSKGLIDSSEYKTLRERLLGINDNKPVQPTTPSQQPISVTVPQPTSPLIGILGQTPAMKARQDALENFKAGWCGGGTLLATVFGSAVIGLAPAIACSTSFNENNANYPNSELAKNPDYRTAYIRQCRQMKRTNAWGCWGAGTAINIVAWIVIGTVIAHHN